MKQYISLLAVTLFLALASTTSKAQSDINVIMTEAHGTQVLMSLDPFGVQNAIDSLTVLISEVNGENSSGSANLDGRIDSLAQLVLMLDSAQTLGTDGQVLQVATTDGTKHVSWVDVDVTTYTAGTGVDLTADVFSIGQAVATTDDVTFSKVNANGKTSLNDSLIVAGSATISGSLLIDSISVTDVINGQVGSIENHNIDALNDVPGMGSPGSYLRVKSDSTGLEYASIEETTYTAGTGVDLTADVFSIGQAVATTDDVTFDDVTADSLTATITFLDTAMIDALSVDEGRFTIGELDGNSYVANYISNTRNIQNSSSNLAVLHSEEISMEFANNMSETGIQGQVGSVKGMNFTGNGLRESHIGVSKDSLFQAMSGDSPPQDQDVTILYESLLAAALSQEIYTIEGVPNPDSDSEVLVNFFSLLPIEAGILNESSVDGPSEIYPRESTVTKKNSAFSAYQSSGLRNVRQIYQALADSSDQAYVATTDGDTFEIDSIDFSTTAAQTILQTYNDKYVDFEYLEMTAQDSGLTVTHDDYGIALSTGTRYEQATDSTVTRIPATTGLEMHAGSGKAVLYADTIEFRGVVQMYEDVEIIGDMTAPNIVEQNMGTYIANETSFGTGNGDRLASTYTTSNGANALVPLVIDDNNSKQPGSEDYSYGVTPGNALRVSGDDARGTYLVSATMTVQNLSEDDVSSGYQAPSGLVTPHSFDLRPYYGATATEIFPGCETSFYYLGDSTEVTVNLTCYIHHEDSGDLTITLNHENRSTSETIAIKDGSVGIRKLNHYNE